MSIELAPDQYFIFVFLLGIFVLCLVESIRGPV